MFGWGSGSSANQDEDWTPLEDCSKDADDGDHHGNSSHDDEKRSAPDHLVPRDEIQVTPVHSQVDAQRKHNDPQNLSGNTHIATTTQTQQKFLRPSRNSEDRSREWKRAPARNTSKQDAALTKNKMLMTISSTLTHCAALLRSPMTAEILLSSRKILQTICLLQIKLVATPPCDVTNALGKVQIWQLMNSPPTLMRFPNIVSQVPVIA